MFVIYVVFCLALLSVFCGAAQFPPDIRQCHFGDTECLKETVTEIMRNNPDGHAGLNLPKLEPFKILSLRITQGDQSPVSTDLEVKDAEIHGFSNIKVDKFVGFGQDPRTSKYEAYATFPLLRFDGHYKISGRVLFLPISGEGPMNITLTNLQIKLKVKPKLTEKDGKTYWEVEKVKLLLIPERSFYNFENLFNGNKALSDTMNTFLNDNSKEIWMELSESIGTAMGYVVKAVLNAVITKFSYEEIFLPSSS